MILVDTYAGWKGSLPAEEVRGRIEGVRRMLAAPPEEFVSMVVGLGLPADLLTRAGSSPR